MSRFGVWLEELYFEDNAHFGRRTSRLLSVISKTLLTIPHAFMLLFCNFGSAMPRRQRTLDPQPSDPVATQVTLDVWPRSARTRLERGLPYSDNAMSRIDVGNSLSR